MHCVRLLSQGLLNVFPFPAIVQLKHARARAHTHTHTRARRISSVCSSDRSILPHAVVECRRCTTLGTGGRSILGRNTQGNFERSAKKTFNVQGWGCLFRGGVFVWQSRVYVHKPFKVRRCSFKGGVQSNMLHSNVRRHEQLPIQSRNDCVNHDMAGILKLL